MIELKDLSFTYSGHTPLFQNVSLTIESGAHVALSGGNGVGKSTLALLIKGLLMPGSGSLRVDGFDADSPEGAESIMRRVGIVFQNPENTFVATTVERELAFGLENIAVAPAEMRERVDQALTDFDLERYRYRNPSQLSGGEKQRLALAAVMIMRPEHLILDEPTSLLDPWGRAHILDLIHETARSGATVVHITQFADEAAQADRMIVFGRDGILADGKSEDILGSGCADHCVRVSDVSDASRFMNGEIPSDISSSTSDKDISPLLRLEGVGHCYSGAGSDGSRALKDIDLKIAAGTATALIGKSGSGKSTLLEIAAGLIRPSEGKCIETKGLVKAMAFQFPEDQIFGEDIASYVAFGPKNLGLNAAEVELRVHDALSSVGFEAESVLTLDPLSQSGGEQRRIALAGVLAINPGLLILDEPTAGLDREGVDRTVAVLKKYIDGGGTLLFSTHDFAVARCLADSVVLLESPNNSL